MYLVMNGTRYTAKRRYRPKGKDEVKYFGVTPEPGDISGAVKLYRDDGFLLREDDTDGYTRREYSGNTLTLSNEPEPVETGPVEPEASTDEILNALLGVEQ